MTRDEQWLLREKYKCEKSAPVYNESPDEIKNKYSWGEGFFADLERLKAGEPLAYVIGSIPFLNCTIHLDSHPLIPRPETEFWVERAIAEIKRAAPVAPRVLDLCAGSGCIGVAVAKAIPDAEVYFVELDGTHLSTIQHNIRENGVDESKTTIMQGDLLANLPHTFDYILTNPPYIDPTLDRTETSVKNFEPHLALYGGARGMELIARIVAGARASLAPHPTSQLWLEHEPEQRDAIHALAHTHHLTCQTHTDQYDTPRYSVLTVAQ